MADRGEGPGGPGSPLFSDQTEARGAEKHFLETGSHLISRSGAALGLVEELVVPWPHLIFRPN